MNRSFLAAVVRSPRALIAATALAAFAIGGAAGWKLGAARAVSSAPGDSSDERPLREPGYRYVNPLLFCLSTENKEFEEFKPLENKIQTLVDREIASGAAQRISVYFRELDSGHWVGINETEKFSPSSLFKIPIMIAYYKLAESRPGILEERIVYDGFDPTPQSGIAPAETLAAGQSYTISDLIRRMIVYSDNRSANLLYFHINQNSLAEVFSDLGLSQPPGSDTGDVISAKTYSFFFRALYNATYLSREYSERALKLLSRTAFTEGLADGIPPEITLAHKFGDRLRDDALAGSRWQLHDCGIVYYPKNPYLLCVMTAGSSSEKLTSAISDVSKLVYGEIARRERP